MSVCHPVVLSISLENSPSHLFCRRSMRPLARNAILYGSAFASLLAGASVTHYIYKPDLTIPRQQQQQQEQQQQQQQQQQQ